ncbi:hypothetical protein HPB51_016809 [Rhipicephalus microplus]|uniref:Uncharacterized protein n=1 Tax=Rhipicephalus microplus TaxID=6941 RepID=A0A9J6DIR3_RHIMP|nr:hypothetical protein HPB51_016809 [Rhipicephalus microplus]
MQVDAAQQTAPLAAATCPGPVHQRDPPIFSGAEDHDVEYWLSPYEYSQWAKQGFRYGGAQLQMCSSVFQLLGCLLRAAIKQASKDLEASNNEALQQQHQREKGHKKLRFQRAPASPCKEMWSDVARKSDYATIQCHSAISVTPKVTETDTADGYPSLRITEVASTRAPAVTVFTQVKRRPVRAPALVSGTSVHHKVKKTRRTAVPLCSAAFEQSPPSDCGPPDACGVISTVSPQSEGVVCARAAVRLTLALLHLVVIPV